MSNYDIPAFPMIGLKHGKGHMHDAYKELQQSLAEQNDINQIGAGGIIVPQPVAGGDIHDPIGTNNITANVIENHLQSEANRAFDNEIGQTTQVGGKVIGRGGFGCVFRPPLKCVGKRQLDNKWVSKVLKSKYAREEYREYSKINAIDPSFEFHLKIKIPCTPDLTDISTLNQIRDATEDKCKSIFNVPIMDIDKKYKCIQIEDGGMSLYDFMRKEFDIESNEQFLACMKGYLNVLKGLREISKAGYMHADIKQDNILINSDLKMNITDFGLMTKITELVIYIKSRIYFIYPADIIFLSQIDCEDDYIDADVEFETISEERNFERYTEYVRYIKGKLERMETHTIQMLYTNIFGDENSFFEMIDYYMSREFYDKFILGKREDGSVDEKSYTNYISKILYTMDSYAFGLVLGLYYVDIYEEYVPPYVNGLDGLIIEDTDDPEILDLNAQRLFGYIIKKLTDTLDKRLLLGEIQPYFERVVEIAERLSDNL